MRWVTAHAGKLHVDFRATTRNELVDSRSSPWDSGVQSLSFGKVHELLFDDGTWSPLFLAAQLTTRTPSHRTVIWCCSQLTLYPPALAGISRSGLMAVHSCSEDLVWAVAQCLRCRGVGAVIASLPKHLTRVEARRLQLAAEEGNTLGVMMRSVHAEVYAADTRWLITPMRGEQSIQKWKAEFVHGHGWRVGQSFIVERHRHAGPNHRDKISVHSSSTLADRAPASTTSRASA